MHWYYINNDNQYYFKENWGDCLHDHGKCHMLNEAGYHVRRLHF
jgi:hypothetical protein